MFFKILKDNIRSHFLYSLLICYFKILGKKFLRSLDYINIDCFITIEVFKYLYFIVFGI